MSYKINKTDGELLIELADGQIDTTTTDITLIGKNYKGFGELFNENFIKMLENFSSTAAPGSPLVGQLWYDTGEGRLKLYDGESFRVAGGPIVSNTQPDMVAGDMWIDNQNNKLYFFDGTDLILVGPDYDTGQGQTGFEVVSVIDISSRERVILKIWTGGTLFGVISKEEFRLSGTNKIDGYPDDPDDTVFPARQLFEKGFNLVDDEYWYRGTATSARALVDAEGNTKTAANFLPSDENGATTGSLRIKNSAGLSVGIGNTEYAALKIVGSTTTLETQQSGTDIALKVRVGNEFKNALYIDSSEDKIGIYNTAPSAGLTIGTPGTPGLSPTKDLYVTGHATVDGNLTVNGDTTYFNVTKLTIQDKNIELGMLDDSTEGTDAEVDGAGIIIRSVNGSKDWTWENSTQSWTSNQDIDLVAGNEYKVNNTLVLSATELGPMVATSSLTRVGTLVELDVDNITLDANIISTNGGTDLVLQPAGDISVSNANIENLADPNNAQDAATKKYVDDSVNQERIVFSLDVTGLSTPDSDVLNILESLYPASVAAEGKRAVIHCTSYTSITVSGIDISSALTKSYISVLSDDSSAVSVLEDITFSTASGTTTPSPARTTRTYEINASGVWTHVGTASYTP